METDGQGLVIPSPSMPHSVRFKASSAVAVPDHEGEKVDEMVVIYRPLEELFRSLETSEALISFLPHVKSVERTDHNHFKWTIEPISGGRPLKWTLCILRDKPSRMMSWKTVDPSDVASAGSIWLKELHNNRGTTLRMILKFDIPNEHVKKSFNKLYGKSPVQLVREGLRRFKAFIETGEVPSIEGQPHGGFHS